MHDFISGKAGLDKDALSIFYAGLSAVDSKHLLKSSLSLDHDILSITDIRGISKSFDLKSFKRIIITGGGKAAGFMANALEEVLQDKISKGWVNVRYGFIEETKIIFVHEAGHPLPDLNGLKGAEKIAELAIDATEQDLIINLLSGGASALIPLPDYGISLSDLESTTKQLLHCGASVREINCLRKHLSSLKGGRFARLAYPATVISLIISDVIDDHLDTIGSGPTVPDSTTFKDAYTIVEKYNLAVTLPISVMNHILGGVKGEILESPKPDNFIFAKVHNFIIGSNSAALAQMQIYAAELGYLTVVVSKRLMGDVDEAIISLASEIEEICELRKMIGAKICLLGGGEVTVKVNGDGIGGRNSHFCLGLADKIAGFKNVVVLSAGTDGNDGNSDGAGAIISGDTIYNGKLLGLDQYYYYNRNDSYSYFCALGDEILTGPTTTNVMDLRVVLLG